MAKQSTQHNYSLPVIKGGLSKKQISILVEQSINKVLINGNPFEVIEVVAVMGEFIKLFRNDERFTDYLREQLARHNGKYTSHTGVKIETCEVASIYDYSNDASWKALDKAFNELVEKKKEIEDRLRKIPPGKILVDEETGEVLTGPSKSSKSSYKITLLKQ